MKYLDLVLTPDAEFCEIWCDGEDIASQIPVTGNPPPTTWRVDRPMVLSLYAQPKTIENGELKRIDVVAQCRSIRHTHHK